GARWSKWLERGFTDRKVRGSNPTSATRLPLSRLGQPGIIPALVLPSGGMAARHRKGATVEHFLSFFFTRSFPVQLLLDKLLVACPNSQFCNVVLERSGLEEHLRERCPGSPGCCRSFDDSSLTRHRHTSTKERFPPISAHISGAVGSASSTVSRKAIGSTQSPLTGSRRTAGFTPRLLAGSHTSPFQPVHVLQSCDRVRPDVKLPLSDIDETYDAPVVKEGVPVSVVIRRSPGCADLGFTFVGGVDTPLSCVLIQEIYLDGAVALDGRLRPGDQILELGIILPVLFSSCFLRLNTSLCRLCYFPERLDSRSTSLNLCTRPSMYSDILASHHEHKNDVKVVFLAPFLGIIRARLIKGAKVTQWLERKFTERKVCCSNPASTSRLPLSKLGRPNSIPPVALPSGSMAARYQKGVTAERFFCLIELVLIVTPGFFC
ncbi:hypothetical protein T265_14287, partial [Opisthorchis viverrini]